MGQANRPVPPSPRAATDWFFRPFPNEDRACPLGGTVSERVTVAPETREGAEEPDRAEDREPEIVTAHRLLRAANLLKSTVRSMSISRGAFHGKARSTPC